MYSELRDVHPNYALWIVTTHVLKTEQLRCWKIRNTSAENFQNTTRDI